MIHTVPAEATLYAYRWRGRAVFLRMTVDGHAQHSQPPPCPRLYDEVVEIPVVAAGQPPPQRRTRRIPIVGDWLSDLVAESDPLDGRAPGGPVAP